jgi:NADPH:quinone reductase
MTATMRAVVLEEFGGPEVLVTCDVPRPEPRPGWVLIRVMAFGLNRSELHFRRGMGSFGSLPRIPGIEATGVVVEAPGGEFEPGTTVAAVMGGMGRDFDGGYAEYVLVPAGTVIPFTSDLSWAVLGAVPEMIQTANGSLSLLQLKAGDALLIRGGTSSIGLALAVLAKHRGITVLSTTRNPAKREKLKQAGVNHVLIDSGEIEDQVRQILPDGVSGAVELVGTPSLRDTLRATAKFGTVSFTGMLSDEWIVKDFYPMDFIPNGVRLTAYYGEASDLPADVLQAFLDSVSSGEVSVPLGKVYGFDEIVRAHRDMEEGAVTGKLVVVMDQ